MDDQTNVTKLTVPLECCTGRSVTLAPDEPVDGRRVFMTFTYHDLWCCVGASHA
jgi:hypothetical protein